MDSMLFPIDNGFLSDGTRDRNKIKIENSLSNKGKD